MIGATNEEAFDHVAADVLELGAFQADQETEQRGSEELDHFLWRLGLDLGFTLLPYFAKFGVLVDEVELKRTLTVEEVGDLAQEAQVTEMSDESVDF